MTSKYADRTLKEGRFINRPITLGGTGMIRFQAMGVVTRCATDTGSALQRLLTVG